MNNVIPVINSHNSWSQLEEVWLGDVYPASWYDHLEPAVRDVFQQITETTQQDLNQIQKLNEEVYSSEYKFEPIVGEIYHVYKKNFAENFFAHKVSVL